MQIQQIQQNFNTQPNFTHWDRCVLKPQTEEVLHRNTTYFFRDLNLFSVLCAKFVENYKNTDKVNVYCYGCSDGSEPYSFAMKLLSTYPEEAKKFFPIIAKDYDSEAILKAKKNCYFLSYEEKKRISQYTRDKFNDYLQAYETIFTKPNKEIQNISEIIQYVRHSQNNNLYSVKPIIADNVKFEVGNILEDYKNIRWLCRT